MMLNGETANGKDKRDASAPNAVDVEVEQVERHLEEPNENGGNSRNDLYVEVAKPKGESLPGSLKSPLQVTPSGRWCLRKGAEGTIEDISDIEEQKVSELQFGHGTPERRNSESSFGGPLDIDIVVEGEGSALIQPTAKLITSCASVGSQSSRHSQASTLPLMPEATPFQLYDDIYGLIYLARTSHPAFYFAIFIFTIQSLLLLLIFFDMVQGGAFESVDRTLNGVLNRINIPAVVPVSVTVAQFLGILLTVLMVATEGDLTRGCAKLFDGYPDDLVQKDPHATYTTWLLAASGQAFVGLLMTVDCFVLIMRSRTVIEMCLNFAALHFVQEIDGISFAVARRGYISKAVQEECDRVGDYMTSSLPWLRTLNLRRTLLVVITVGLYVPFCWLLYRQWGGYYLCNSLYVQFGGSVDPDLDFFTGIFETKGNFPSNWIDSRSVYLDESGAIQISYCASEKAWVFSKQTQDPCDHFFVLSARTETFDVLEVAGERWSHVNLVSGEVTPFEWLSISCNDCGEQKTSNQICNPEFGQCVERRCQCNEGRMGVNCEFAEPTCRYLYLDFETRGSLASVPGSFVFSEIKYVSLNHTDHSALQINHRPIYVPDGLRNAGTFAFMIFSGRRWIMFGKQPEEHSNLSPLELVHRIQDFAALTSAVEVLQNVSQLDPYKPMFFSSPVNHGTASDSVEPTNVDWVISQSDNGLSILKYRANDQKPVSARFLCSECNIETNPCLNDGICDEGQCKCPPSYHGPLCESAYTCQELGCIYGGVCDHILNICSDCPERYFGSLCQYYEDQEVDQSYCDDVACKNGGTCNPFLQRCFCKLGFVGEFCERVIVVNVTFSVP